MPSTRRWSVPPNRIVATAVLGIVGIFLICGSVGLGAWLVAAFGIAIVAVGAGVFVLSALNSRSTSEIEGTAHVISATPPPSGVAKGRCRLNLILYSKTVDGVGVWIRDDAVPVAKWPDAGDDLPVMITIDKPSRTRVLWDYAPTHQQAAEERARARESDERAAAMTADDDEYAKLHEALANRDDLDGADLSGAADAAAEPPVGEPLLGEPIVDEPLLSEPLLGERIVDEPFAEWDAGQAPTESSTDEPAVVESYMASAATEPAMATTGTRTIEMDVMDPSLMRWTGPPAPRRPDGSRPSPYRRRRSDQDRPTDGPAAEPPGDADGASPSRDVEPAPIEPGPDTVVPIETDLADAALIVTDAADATPIDSALVIDNGQIVGFDILESPPVPVESPTTGTTSRSEPPEWPPRSAAAAAAAAALPHRWHDNDGPDRPEDGGYEPTDRTTASDGPADSDAGELHVPRNRSAPNDELFDQDVPDDGPGFSPGAAYAHNADYDRDAGYNSDADYAEPGRPDTVQ